MIEVHLQMQYCSNNYINNGQRGTYFAFSSYIISGCDT